MCIRDSNGKEGFVFSGFITKGKIPKYNNERHCHNHDWFGDLIRLNVDSLECKGKKFYKGFDPDKGGGFTVWELYSNETMIYHSTGYETTDLIVETRSLNMNDFLNILEYYISEMTACDEAYFSDKTNIPSVKIKKDNEGFIKKISCPELTFFAEKSIYKTVFTINLDGRL